MKFEGQYLTYDEYLELGGTLEEAPFNLLEFEARKKIDKKTQMRLKDCDNIPSEVKLCIFSLIDKIKTYAETTEKASGNVASENTDGYSVSYINVTQVSDIIKSKDDELNSIINDDLYGVIINDEHILYLGVH